MNDSMKHLASLNFYDYRIAAEVVVRDQEGFVGVVGWRMESGSGSVRQAEQQIQARKDGWTQCGYSPQIGVGA